MAAVITAPATAVTTTWVSENDASEIAEVTADFFQENGTPLDEAGDDMEMQPTAHVALEGGAIIVFASRVITTWIYGDEHVEVPLTFFQENGTPISADTGDDMEMVPTVKVLV